MAKRTNSKPGLPPRKRVSATRLRGTIEEWKWNTGWIVAESKVEHPNAHMNGGKIYVHKDDLVGIAASKAIVGMTVEFFLYADSRGLGAEVIRKAGAAGAEKKLPDGWEKHWSEEAQEFYYWNKATKESMWTHPDGDDAEKDEALPLGWSKEYDKEKDAFYYWHKPSRTAQWEPPKTVADSLPKAVATSIAKKEQTIEKAAAPAQTIAGPVIGKTRVQGVVTKWHGFFGWVSPLQELGSALRPALERSGSRIYLNWRDVQGGATLKVGSHVSFKVGKDSSGLTAVKAKLHVEGEDDDEDDEEDEEMDQQEDDEAADKAGADEPAHGLAEIGEAAGGGALLPGWTEQYSEEFQCPYYWHAATKQSSWERPSVPDEDGEDGAANEDGKLWEGEGSEEGAASLATPITPIAGKPGQTKPMTPVTPTPTKKMPVSAGSGAIKGSGGGGQRPPQTIPAWKKARVA